MTFTEDDSDETFKPVSPLRDRVAVRKQAYCQTFNIESPFAQQVIKDLSIFCRANATTFDIDPRQHALLEGRREVWLRIQSCLLLTPDQLLKILGA